MRGLLRLNMVAVALIAAGCAHTRGGGEVGAQTTDPPCKLASTKAKTCVLSGGQTVCDIYVGEVDGETYVYPYILSAPAGVRELVVVWHHQATGAKFVKGGVDEDGPKWKDPASPAEFVDGEPTEDPQGARDGRTEGTRYRITFRNTAAATHNYVIQYRKGTTIKRCDPQIVSEAG